MPTGPGGLDSNGIWQFGEDDSEALASDLLNLGMGSVSTAISTLGGVLQVVSTTKTDTYSASTLTVAFTGNVTGMSASITPVATSSKILVLLSANGAISDANPVIAGRVLRGSTAIGVGATEGSRTSLGGVAGHDRASALIANLNLTVLDSPSTISEITYNFQMFNILGATKTLYLNRNEADTNSAATVRAASTITLIEVAG